MARSWRLILLFTLLTLMSVPGCSSVAWQRYQESPANPVTWVRAIFPPDGETFYSDEAQSIDHHLQRSQATLDQ